MNTKQTIANLGLHFGVSADVNIIREGVRLPFLKNEKNLILDSGMINFGANSLSSLQTMCQKGDSDLANSLDSGVITMTQSGVTVTASSSIFTAGMVGELLKPDSGGEEVYITGFTSDTIVSVGTSQTVSAIAFTVWYVSRTTLESYLGYTSTLNASDSRAISAGVITLTATHIFSANVAGETIRELGWGLNANNVPLSRVVLSSPVALGIGDQLEVISNLEVRQSNQTPTAIDPTSDEGAFAGNAQVEGYGIDDLESQTGKGGEPYSALKLFIDTRSNALATYGTPSIQITSSSNKKSATMGSDPTSAPWIRTGSAVWGTSEGNIAIRSLGLCGGQFDYSIFRLLLTAAQTKLNTQTLTIAFSVSWDRNLTN